MNSEHATYGHIPSPVYSNTQLLYWLSSNTTNGCSLKGYASASVFQAAISFRFELTYSRQHPSVHRFRSPFRKLGGTHGRPRALFALNCSHYRLANSKCRLHCHNGVSYLKAMFKTLLLDGRRTIFSSLWTAGFVRRGEISKLNIGDYKNLDRSGIIEG